MSRFAFSRPTRVACVVTVALIFIAPSGLLEGGSAGDDPPVPMAGTYTLALNVTNVLAIDRPYEVVELNLTLPDTVITDSTNFTVRRQSDGNETLSGPLNSTVEYYPSGYIHRMRIAFQDIFLAGERKGYIVKAGERTSLGGDMGYSIAPPYVIVTDGNATDLRTYRIFTDHSIDYWTTGVRVYYNHTTYPYEAQSGILVRVGGDQLSLDQTNFQIGWGIPDLVTVDNANAMVSVHLLYKSPYAVQWGRGMLQFLVKDVDMIWADIVIKFYNNRSVIDAHVSKKINEKFYNHNGFVMETSILLAGNGNYEYIYGTPEQTRAWANTTSLNWAWDQTRLVGMDAGNRSAPAAGDLDGDGDLDLLVGSLDGAMSGYRNVGGPTNPTYNSDQSLSPGGAPWDNCTIPALGDLDGDGDLDLVVGLLNGTVIAFRNTGSPAVPSWNRDDSLVAGVVGPFAMPNAAPELADLDDDGDLDLLVGHADGTFQFFRNIGSPASPTWSQDDAEFDYLNKGATLKPGTFATPEIVDVNRDGLIDFVSGTGYTTMGSLVYFENEGTNAQPLFSRLYPAMFNNVRGGAYYNRDYSVPDFADFDGDGLDDIIMGVNDGTMQLWINQGYTMAERHVNTMEPLENGSYRFYHDQDGNDGQYVINNYTSDFEGFYVVANPATNAAVLRYIPDFARYAYRDRYSGEMYPWAGGNTSYYPFIPNEDGRVTRGIVISRSYSDPVAGGYGVGASYLSQTGTAGGFVQVPMTAMEHRSRETLVMELPYDPTVAIYYEEMAKIATPMHVEADADITLRAIDITTDPTDPARGMDVIVSASVWNVGHSLSNNVRVEFFDGDPMAGGIPIGTPQTIPSIPEGYNAMASVTWNTAGVVGPRTIFVALDGLDTITELDEDNNVANRTFVVTGQSRTWGEEVMLSQSKYNDMDPDIVVDALGRVWISWHTFETGENFDFYATDFDGVRWGSVESLGKGFKHTSGPALVAAPDGDVLLIFSSNVEEYDRYIATKNAIYYWSQKFDLWMARHSYDGWHPPERFTDALALNDSDMAPRAVFTPDGKLWTVYRHTHFQLYTQGFQMYNIPYQDMNVTARSFDGTSWSGEQIVDNSPGSQGWWGGATIAVAPNGTLWAIYESEVGQLQWELYASMNSGAGWSRPVRLTTNGVHDIRPVAAFDSTGRLWVAWEKDEMGNKDIYARFHDGVGWSSDIQISTDPGEDMKPSIAADPNGFVFIAWESDRTGNKDVFLRVYNTTGWSPEFQVTTDVHSDEHVRIAAAQGGVWFVWETDRNGHGDKDVYFKTLNLQVPRPGPTDLRARLWGSGYTDVRLTWNLSADDWLHGTVTGYRVLCGDVYDRDGVGYMLMASAPAGANFAVVQNRGHGDPTNIFCHVLAEGPFGLSAPSNQAGAFKVPLTGHNLVSAPLLIEDTDPDTVFAPLLSGISPAFTYARHYDPLDPQHPWRMYSAQARRDLTAVDNSMGLWMGTNAVDQFTVAGVVPVQHRISLKAGWNLVGYPTLTPRMMADALAGLPVLRVESYDPTVPAYDLKVMAGSELMVPGQGYWILMSSDADWLING